MQESLHNAEIVPIGVGYYTAAEAARLLKTTPRNISRWLGGYSYKISDGHIVESTPLWSPQLPRLSDGLEIGFRDLIELVTTIEDYVDHHNQRPKPFIWTPSADIVEKVKRAPKALVNVQSV